MAHKLTNNDAPLGTTARFLSSNDLDCAVRLFEKDPGWGTFYGEKFRDEMQTSLTQPPSAVFGLFTEEQRLIAVGAVLKELFDYAYWSITWIFVDLDHRGKGVGRTLVRTLLEYAQQQQKLSHNPNCRVLLSANSQKSAAFYQSEFGFRTLAEGPLDGEHLMYVDLSGPGLPIRRR
jgi:GNAT superfamily N-acetyltransferase